MSDTPTSSTPQVPFGKSSGAPQTPPASEQTPQAPFPGQMSPSASTAAPSANGAAGVPPVAPSTPAAATPAAPTPPAPPAMDETPALDAAPKEDTAPLAPSAPPVTPEAEVTPAAEEKKDSSAYSPPPFSAAPTSKPEESDEPKEALALDDGKSAVEEDKPEEKAEPVKADKAEDAEEKEEVKAEEAAPKKEEAKKATPAKSAKKKADKNKSADVPKNEVQAILAKNEECMKARHKSLLECLSKIKEDDLKTLTDAIDDQVTRVKDGETSGIGIFEKDNAGVTEETVTRFLAKATHTKAEIERLFEVAGKVVDYEGDLSKLDEQSFVAVREFHARAFEALTEMEVFLGIAVNVASKEDKGPCLATSAKMLNEAGRLSDEALDYYDQEERRRMELDL